MTTDPSIDYYYYYYYYYYYFLIFIQDNNSYTSVSKIYCYQCES